MKLIIDAGSTKTEWILMDRDTVVRRFQTEGFNPNYSERQCLENIVSSVKTQCLASQKNMLYDIETLGIAPPQSIHYYGTGCGNEKNCQIVKEVFLPHFPSADIHVTHDLMAACHALLGHEKGIACILGTGSNSCVYDGNHIVVKGVSLGYLVGDEGSGMHIGREVVKSYYYGFMPETLRHQFEEEYHLETNDFLQHLYHERTPSKYLASFAEFASKHRNDPFIHDLVKDCFDAFLQASVLRLDGCRKMKVSFVGSVSYHFSNILEEALEDRGLAMGTVMASPTEGLVRYYSETALK